MMILRRSERPIRKRRAYQLESLERKELLAGDLVSHWLADSLNATVADQSVVPAWTDSVGNTQATSVGSPTLVKGAIGGRSAIRFELSDGIDSLSVPSLASPLSGAGDFSIAVAFRSSSTDLATGGAQWFNASGLVDGNALGFSKDWGLTINQAGTLSAGLGTGLFQPIHSFSSTVSGLNDGQLHVAVLTRAGGTMSMYVDGAAAGTMTGADSAPRDALNLVIGKTSSGNNGFDGEIAEVRIYDGELTTAEAVGVTNSITAYYNNAVPVAVADTYSIPEDPNFSASLVPVGRGVLVNDTDADKDPLTAVLVENTQHGSVALNADGSFIYTPTKDFFGVDTFKYAAKDFRESAPTTVTINVTPVYDPAVATPDQYKLLAGTTLNVGAANGLLANDTNPDQVVRKTVVVQNVPNGNLSLADDGSFTYNPQGFAGTTSFTYRIEDGIGTSNTATVTLIVNTPPTANNDQFQVDEDTLLVRTKATGVLANDQDKEGNQVVVSLVDNVQHGQLTLQPDGGFTYQPDLNYVGADSFTYQTTDGIDPSGVATVNLTVRAVNDAPQAQSDTYFGLSGQPIVVASTAGVLANDTDVEMNPLTARVVSNVAQGTLTFKPDGSLTLQPPTEFTGVLEFTYVANDGQADSQPATVSFVINSLQDQQQVIINELHVDPDLKTEHVEFIELYNAGSVPVSLAGWTLRDAISYTFPAGSSIPAGGYFVVAQNPAHLATKYQANSVGPWTGKLRNEGDTVELWTNSGTQIDAVDYQVGFPWPLVGELGGPSMQLIHPSMLNDLGGNWRSAAPTPGAQNAVFADNAAPAMRKIAHSPVSPMANQVVTITALVTDPDGVQSVELEYQLVNPGDYIKRSDPRYATEWTKLVMRDDGQNGDATAGDFVYSVQLPADLQTHRRLVRYRVTSTDAKGASLRAPYEDDLQPNFAYFVYNGVPSWTGAARPGVTDPVTYSSELLESVPVYQLITTRENHVDSQFIPNSSLRSGYTGNEYQWEGTMVYNGQVYDHIGFRARGGVWRYAMGKNMWKFDFHRGHRFQAHDDFGQAYETTWDKLNFSALIQQGDYLHRGEQGLFESVGFKLYNLAGTEAPNTNYVHFRIIESENETGADQYSGDFQGLYLAIEQPDGNMLDEHGLPDGNFYKIENNQPESTSNQGPDQVSDASDVRSFMREFTGSRRPAVEWWQDNLDLERYYSYQAISQAIHHYDTAFGKNFYYYANPETGKFQIHPWDLDLTWADNMFGNENHEFNTKVAKNNAFNNYVNQANIDLNNRLNHDYQNRTREILDLLYNSEQTGMIIDQVAAHVYQPGEPSFVDADRAVWDYNPIIATASRYTNSSKNGTRFHYYDRAATKDFPGMIKILKDYINTRTNFINRVILTNEANIPQTPTASYNGPANFPVDQLRFKTNAFASPIDATFAGMEWRIAEITDPNAPGFNPFDTTTPHKYEIESLWESGELSEFSETIEIPGHLVEAGKTYRVRVRMLDNDNHWSHWSAPVQFVATAATGDELARALRVTEVNYNPAGPSAAELAAGFTSNNDFEFIEIMNISNQTVDLSGAALVKVETANGEEGVDFRFADGSVSQLLPGQTVVVVEDLDAFRARYGNSALVAGQWDGRLGNGGELITLTGFGNPIQSFTYSDEWHPSTDGEGRTLEAADPKAADLNVWNTQAGWKASAAVGGSPGVGANQRVPGDSNGDGIFNSSDMVFVFLIGKYEDGIPQNATFEEGDWNGDGDFDSSDFIHVFLNGNYEQAAAPGLVPTRAGTLTDLAIDSLFGELSDSDDRLRWRLIDETEADVWGAI